MTAGLSRQDRDGPGVSGRPEPSAPDPTISHRIQRSIAPRQGDVTDFLAAFSRDAAGRVENRLRLDDAVIVLGEVLNNIVEHACAGSAGTGIDITVDFGPTAIMIEATDDGRPLPPSCLTGASLPASDMAMDDLPEGGFGWFMIHEIAEDMAYERTDGRNHLTFSVPT